MVDGGQVMVDEIMEEDIGGEEVEADQYLVFTVKSQEFGFQAMRVQEISRVLDITEVPSAPSYIEGIMNLRGRLASVINFRNKFGFEPKEHDEDTRTIIIEQGGFPIGVVVDSVEEVIKIADDMVQKLPESTSTSVSEEYMTGVGMLENRLIILLDVDKVLTKTELMELGAMSEMMDKARKTPEKAENRKTPEKAENKKTPEKTETKKIDAAEHPQTKKKTGKRGGR